MKLHGATKKTGAAADVDYAAGVVDVLVVVGGFSDLADPSTAEMVRRAIATHGTHPAAGFECIVDNPSLANWRLRPHLTTPGRVRLACHRFQETPADVDRARRVNVALERMGAS